MFVYLIIHQEDIRILYLLGSLYRSACDIPKYKKPQFPDMYKNRHDTLS